MRSSAWLSLGLLLFAASPALAFHDGGVAHCNGCHTMHNSQDGQLVDPDSPNGNAWLLVDATPSDVCLGCHATNHGAVFAVDPLNPAPLKGAGNFIFLLEENLNDGHAGGDSANWIPGDAAGHNLDAPGFGLAPDATLSTAPGGFFPGGSMGCTSCHDPHGNPDFRMLYGAGRLVQELYTFDHPAPDAEGLSIHGSGEESNSNHTAYRSGMDLWCANCHSEFHHNLSIFIHRSGAPITGPIAQIYNAYNGSDDITGGSQATAYLAAVPFEDPSNTTTSTAGPGPMSQISCITCHRAHASSAPDAGRWDFNVTFLRDDGVESDSYAIPNPYTAVQRSLCNKCHRKDEYDRTLGTASVWMGASGL